MKKNGKKNFDRLALRYENPQLEEGYVTFTRLKSLERPVIYFLALITGQIFLIVLSLSYFHLKVKIAQGLLLAFSLAMGFCIKKMGEYVEHFTFIISFISNVILQINLAIQINELSLVNMYLQIYALGAIQQLFTTWLFRFKFILVNVALTLTARLAVFFVITSEDREDYLVELTITILIDTVHLYSMYNRELSERRIFKRFCGYSGDIPDPKYRLLFESMPQSVLVMNFNLKTDLITNKSFDKAFLVEEADNFQIALASLNVFRDDFDSQEDFQRLFENESEITLFDFLARSVKGKMLNKETITIYASDKKENAKQRLFEVKITRIIWDRHDAILVMLNDITQEKEIISTKVHDASKDRLINTISNELKTPIHEILAMIALDLQTTKDPHTLSTLDFCQKSALILLNFVNSIIDLQLVRNNKLKLKMSKGNLESILKEVKSLYQLHCAEKKISLNYRIQKDVPKYVYTDLERLTEILTNLVGNAVKFTNRGGITMNAKIDPNHKNSILFEVEDTGVGIMQHEQKRIFNLYGKNAHEDDKSTSRGAGVGLTISNYLAKMLNHNKEEEGIKCVSEPTKGSVFSFSILNHHEMFDNRGSGERSSEKRFSRFLEDVEDSDVDARIQVYNNKIVGGIRSFDHLNMKFSLPTLNGGHNAASHASRFNSLNSDQKTPDVRKSKAANPSLFTSFLKPRKEKRMISILVSPPKLSNMVLKPEIPKLQGWVLLVDDNPLNILVAKKLLEDTGCQVMTAVSGHDALEKVEQHMASGHEFFKFILMDCQMPGGLDGFETTKILRGMMARKEIPNCQIIALITDDTEDDLLDKCRECGMDEVLSKPLKFETLHRLLENLESKQTDTIQIE